MNDGEREIVINLSVSGSVRVLSDAGLSNDEMAASIKPALVELVEYHCGVGTEHVLSHHLDATVIVHDPIHMDNIVRGIN